MASIATVVPLNDIDRNQSAMECALIGNRVSLNEIG